MMLMPFIWKGGFVLPMQKSEGGFVRGGFVLRRFCPTFTHYMAGDATLVTLLTLIIVK